MESNKAKERMNTVIQTGSCILNLGAGKLDIGIIKSGVKKGVLLVNVDLGYQNKGEMTDTIISIEVDHIQKQMAGDPNSQMKMSFVNCDIRDFLETYKYKFDTILAMRIFEHMFYDSGQVGHLLHLCHSALEEEGKLHILVPDHLKLASDLIQLETGYHSEIEPPIVNSIPIERTNRQILYYNTEFCNTATDPHGSIWTPALAEYYIESEGGWKIIAIERNIEWDGRDHYMWIELERR